MTGQTPPHSEQRGKLKTSKLPVKLMPMTGQLLRKPPWIRVKPPAGERVIKLKALLRLQKLHTVCEEAACPNLNECFSGGTATFMIMGDICTRRCPFCNVAHGHPRPLDPDEPEHLAHAIETMSLRYVVITSVDRDDLKDGGAGHFRDCIKAIRGTTPGVSIEILVPDFRHRMEPALAALAEQPPDVFNHNLETVPRLYKKARPVANYQWSLMLLRNFKRQHPHIPVKSGLMLGLGEHNDEIKQVLRDLRAHQCDMVTLGQYLQPSRYHLPIDRFIPPSEFEALGYYARSLGFSNVASAPLVRSSYHADLQSQGQKNDLSATQ